MRIQSTTAAEEYVGLSFINRPGASARSPLVVLVHGRAGSREVMWSFDRCIPKGAAVVAFQGFLADPIGGFSWWDLEGSGSKRDAIRAAVSDGKSHRAVADAAAVTHTRVQQILRED